MEKIYNNKLLKEIFTNNEFNFIERIDSDIESSKKILEKSENNKELITKLIKSLNDSIYFKGINNESSENEKLALQNSEDILKLVKYNIEILKSTSEISNSIKQNIVNLLVKSDDNSIFQDNYTTEINTFKNRIEEYSKILEQANPQIVESDQKISEFLNSHDIQEYIKNFSLNSENGSETVESEQANTKNTTDSGMFEENNNILLVSEKEKRVYLPYSKEEVLEYIKQYPEQYSSFNDVVRNEFIFPIELYLKHPLASRFRETYSLMRDREAKSILESFKYAIDIMFHYDLNPTIVAACKTQEQLKHYLKCLEEKNLTNFNDFEIKFDVNPLQV